MAGGLRTTTIGAWPKPAWLPLPDWFQGPAGPDTASPTARYAAALDALGPEAPKLIARAVEVCIGDQVGAGIAIPTDGEIKRENYIHYHCRHLTGIDFETLTEQAVRGGTYTAALPTVTGKVGVRDHFLADDWRLAQSFTERPVKITLPGPMTVTDTTANIGASEAYDDPAELGRDLALALNAEIRDLAAAGCSWIQVDEPVMARKPQAALDYGLENLARCFEGIGPEVTRCVHMCCGYPDRIDRDDYPKADRRAYFDLMAAMDGSPAYDAVSIEDAHRHNDLALFDLFKEKTLILGLVAVAKSRVESAEEIRRRLAEVLAHVEAERVIAAPDCGLGLLTREQAVAKLSNLCAAASAV